MTKSNVLLIGRAIGVIVVASEIVIQCGDANITTLENVINAIQMHNLVNFINPVSMLYLSIVFCTVANMLCFEVLIRVLVYGIAAFKEKVKNIK
jgi:hypothetical protein